jgi:hypothetical protein
MRGTLKILKCRKIEILLTSFVCLFFILLSVGEAQAKVKPKPQVTIKDVFSETSWTIYLSHNEVIEGKGVPLVEKDVLTFTGNTVVSENLSAQGYSKAGSSYKVSIGPGGNYTWQAVMLHENQKDIVLLKGELKNEVMTGVIVYQPEGGLVKTVHFTTIPPE